MSFPFHPAVSCAESVLQSSPDCTPELVQSSFAAPQPQRTAGGLKSLAERARERRHASLALQGGLSVVEEEDGKGQPPAVRSSPPRVRPHRRTTLPALRLPSPSSNARAYSQVQASVPQSASLPPSPPDSPSVYNWTLPSPGIVSPLSAYSHLTPSSLSRAPWTEIVFPRDLAAENGRSSSPEYSDGDDTSEEGACTTPTSITTFGSVQDKDANGGYMALVIPKTEVLPVPHRWAPLPPTVVLNGKAIPLSTKAPSAAVSAHGQRRRSSLPTLEQITARMAAKEGGHPTIVRRSTAPDSASLTLATTPSTTTTSTTSRLPSFLLARRTDKKAAQENVKPVEAVVMTKPAFEVPVFTVTPPQERGEGGRKVLAVLNRRVSGGAPKVVVHEPAKLWV